MSIKIYINPNAINSDEEYKALEDYLRVNFEDESRWELFKSLEYFEDEKQVLIINRKSDILLSILEARWKWDWLEVNICWFSEEVRKSKNQKNLLTSLFTECFHFLSIQGIKFETQSIELKQLYESVGFTVYGILDDYPPGLKTYCLFKKPE